MRRPVHRWGTWDRRSRGPLGEGRLSRATRSLVGQRSDVGENETQRNNEILLKEIENNWGQKAKQQNKACLSACFCLPK